VTETDMCRANARTAGFTLLEVMIALVMMLVVSGSAFYALSAYEKTYRSGQLRADMHSSLRAALEIMTQEIGQAGLLTFSPITLGTTAVTGNLSAQSVTVCNSCSTSNIFVGEKLLVDVGAPQELVAVTAKTATTITGIFLNNHAAGAAVTAVGVFPAGIMTTSGGSQLQLFGDINGDGNIYFVEYDCDTSAGTLSRSITNISGATNRSTADILVQNIIANPGGTACFQPQTTALNGYTFVTSLGITLSVQTASRDPQTNQYVTMTKSFLNIAPRNVIDALDLSQASMSARLQPTPSNLPLH